MHDGKRKNRIPSSRGDIDISRSTYISNTWLHTYFLKSILKKIVRSLLGLSKKVLYSIVYWLKYLCYLPFQCFSVRLKQLLRIICRLSVLHIFSWCTSPVWRFENGKNRVEKAITIVTGILPELKKHDEETDNEVI